jgi:hypothetical protein
MKNLRENGTRHFRFNPRHVLDAADAAMENLVISETPLMTYQLCFSQHQYNANTCRELLIFAVLFKGTLF